MKVLDKGFVELIDVMGDDYSIVDAARVSYKNQNAGRSPKDKSLIEYLMKHRHTSPFEMVSFKFHCKMPIFVARQWVRHRTAKISEVSARYREMEAEFYIPEVFRKQAKVNKQGSEGQIENNTAASDITIALCARAYTDYLTLLGLGVAKEQARMILPVNLYTEWYWKIDLHNLLHFLTLRCDSHAQWEIQQYANAIKELITPIVPLTMDAYKNGNQI